VKTNGLVLGLDIGIGSVGSALLDVENGQVKFTGVRCFESGENPKDGKSLGRPRRMSKAARRRLRRRRVRLNKLLRELSVSGLFSGEISSTGHLPWKLRYEGLRRLLTGEELAIALYHIAKRRGYHNQSVRIDDSNLTADSVLVNSDGDKDEEESKEEQKMLAGVAGLRKLIKDDGAESVGAYFYKQLFSSDGSEVINQEIKIRNESGNYSHTVLRSLLRDEVVLLFDRQRRFGNTKLTAELEKRLVDEIIFYQRPLQNSADQVGNCTFINTERRGPKNAPSMERFRVLQLLNNTRLLLADGTEARIDIALLPTIADAALHSGELKFKQLRKLLGLSNRDRFFGVDYGSKKSGKGTKKDTEGTDPTAENFLEAESAIFISLKGTVRMRRAIESVDRSYWSSIRDNFDLLDDVATILSYEKDISKREHELTRDLLIPAAVASKLAEIQFSTFGRLSLKAARMISDYLLKGYQYDVACEHAGFNHYDPRGGGKKGRYLPPLEETNNPVVDRTLRQARKVFNAIVREFGVPEMVHIELARDLGRSFKDRRKIEKTQKGLAEERESRDEEILRDFGEQFLTPKFRTKYRLWKLQWGRCAYSGDYIDTEKLRSDDQTQVDHIVPLSISGDDSLANKVLVTTASNQNKGKLTPWQYFGHDAARWERFCEAISRYPAAKRAKLLKKEWADEDAYNFRQRNLNDTRYAARRFKDHIIQYIDFGDEGSRHVYTRTGRLTSDLRRLWGLEKNREESDRHHALDAAVVAASTESNLQRITRYHRRKEDHRYGLNPEWPRIEPPWESFRSDIVSAVSKVFVSRPPRIKDSGRAHEDTIRSERIRPDGSRVVVERIKLQNFDAGTQTKDRISISEFRKKYLDCLWNKPRSAHVVAAVEEALSRGEQEGKKLAFEVFGEPVHLRMRNGERGPQVKSIQIETTEKSGLYVRGSGKRGRGIASNGDMLRIDIFHSYGSKTAKKGYYMVPVYVHHLASGVLPNRACTSGKREEEWTKMTEEYQFLFSLYPYDYVILRSKDETFEGYYRGADIASGSLAIYPHFHMGKSSKTRKSIKTLLSLTKLKVDILGRTYPVEREERIWPGELLTSRTPRDSASAGLSF
jgi:CRISPR-associated endonuclease Csn1